MPNYSTINKDKFINMYNAGAQYADIAKETKLTERQVRYAVQKMNLPKRARSNPKETFTEAWFCELWTNGTTGTVISETFGISTGSIWYYVNKYGLPRRNNQKTETVTLAPPKTVKTYTEYTGYTGKSKIVPTLQELRKRELEAKIQQRIIENRMTENQKCKSRMLEAFA